MSDNSRSNPSVAIIGAGMTGILVAIRLREAGITDITMLEKADRLGGTWRENTYPGVACDVPAHMYTYSFRGNPEWKHRLAHGEEIQAYFEQVAAEYGITDMIRFNEALESSHYRDGRWHLRTSRGEQLEVDFVVAATGILHHPAYPEIEGLDSFSGDLWHTARWNHDVDLRGKRVGIIGTGSTATQVISSLAGRWANSPCSSARRSGSARCPTGSTTSATRHACAATRRAWTASGGAIPLPCATLSVAR